MQSILTPLEVSNRRKRKWDRRWIDVANNIIACMSGEGD